MFILLIFYHLTNRITLIPFILSIQSLITFRYTVSSIIRKIKCWYTYADIFLYYFGYVIESIVNVYVVLLLLYHNNRDTVDLKALLYENVSC